MEGVELLSVKSGNDLEGGNLDKKVIHICVVAFGEMGHFIPCTHVADALIEAGHQVTFITNGNEYIREKAPIFLNSAAKLIHTEDTIPVGALMMAPEGCEEPGEKNFNIWEPFVKKAVENCKPDIIVTDFVSYCGALAG